MDATKRKPQDDDVVSHYGSISGETFVSRRTRRDYATRMNSVDRLASNLREYHAKSEDGHSEGAEAEASGAAFKRFNTSFHHTRIIVLIMGGISVGLMMLMRYSITISILRMVNQTHLYLAEHPNRTVEDFLEEGYALGGEFNWNNEIVAIILSWYMFSYTLPQMPTSRLSAKIGCRFSVPISLTICAVSLLLTPWFAYLGWEWVLILRLINGVGASAVLPMLLNLVEIWMRHDEISYGLSIAQTLNASFITLTPLISGYLTEIHWSYAFYVPGAFSIAFCLLWILIVADCPEKSSLISAKELQYIKEPMIESGVANTEDKRAADMNEEQAHQAVSWVAILRVPSFYAYMLMWCFYCSSYSGFTFVLPTYMRQFLKVKVTQNGFYCFLIQSGSILSVLWPHPTLRLLQRCGLSITRARIVAYAICCSMVALTWIYVGALHNCQLLMLFLNRCFQNGNDIIVVGSLMSNYAQSGLSSIAFSLVNTIGNLSIVGVSTFFGWLLDYTGKSREGWLMIYMVLGVFQILMFIIFALFIDSEPINFKPAIKAAGTDAKGVAKDSESGVKKK